MKELTIAAAVENIETATDFVNEQLENAGCPMKAQLQIDVAIDEILSNIVHYAYEEQKGTMTLQLEVEEDPLRVILIFMDQGRPYDPLKNEDPDVTQTAEERAIGGLGIFLVKKTMDAVEYAYRDGRNILTIKKHIE